MFIANRRYLLLVKVFTSTNFISHYGNLDIIGDRFDLENDNFMEKSYLGNIVFDWSFELW